MALTRFPTKLKATNERGQLIMPATIEKPKIQRRYRNADGWQCPLHALENEEYCKFHLLE